MNRPVSQNSGYFRIGCELFVKEFEPYRLVEYFPDAFQRVVRHQHCHKIYFFFASSRERPGRLHPRYLKVT